METNRIKALVVDDDPQFLKIIKHELENKDCVVQTAQEQNTALSFLINEAFHVVFIDCVLKSGQGGDLLKDIRKILGSSVEVIMMSGIIPSDKLSHCHNFNVADILRKPLSGENIEHNLKKIKEKHIHGHKTNLLDKLFSQPNSNLGLLKFLITVTKIKSHEFFIYLNSMLLSNESFSLSVKINNKKHKIICNSGAIIDYEHDNMLLFLESLLKKKLIPPQAIEQLKGKNQKECQQTLLNNCLLSSYQIADVKHDMLFSMLQEIAPDTEVSFEIKLIPPKKEWSALLEREEWAKWAFRLLKKGFNKGLLSLFDKTIMERSLIFKKEAEPDFPELKDLLNDLKSGLRLKDIYNKHDKNSFGPNILYILFKSGAYLSPASSDSKYSYLNERYKRLYQFISQNEDPERLFLKLSPFPPNYSIDFKEIKEIHLRFVKNNHPDTMPLDISKELLNLIHKNLSKIRASYNICADPHLKIDEEKKKKNKELEQEIIWTEKKKICERYLEKGYWAKALSLIQSIPEQTIDKENNWQLLYLWLHLINHIKSIGLNMGKNKSPTYIKNIQACQQDLKKNKLYHYILGLNHENKKNYTKAKMAFENARALDPTFQSCYPAIKRCLIKILEDKKNKEPLWMSKLKTLSLNNLIKKSKKAS